VEIRAGLGFTFCPADNRAAMAEQPEAAKDKYDERRGNRPPTFI
jgi:hypothetical protein